MKTSIGKEDVMNKDNKSKQTSISKAGSLEEIAEFWDTHSLADYWDQTHEFEFEVRANPTSSSLKIPNCFYCI